jgi:uncharacterized protein
VKDHERRLRRGFRPPSDFQATDGYSLLPFRFSRLPGDRCVLTNLAGDCLVLRRKVVDALVRRRLSLHCSEYDDLKSRHFLTDAESSSAALELLATQYRTRFAHLASFTGLHIFVTTLRCNSTCTYCQASRQSATSTAYDMSPTVADKAVDFMFCSPSPTLKVEFQGGEPLLNFDIVRRVVERVEARNETERRDIEFVICSNLSVLSDDMLRFCVGRPVHFSTSLDGPAFLHNANRPSTGGDSHTGTVAGIARVRAALGPDRVSALMTTSRASLKHATEIVDEYVARGFGGIFLRELNPYGFAAGGQAPNAYSTEEWLGFYKRALQHILEINYARVPFKEQYAALILRKMLTSFGTGFVDLQSPAGIGLSVLAYRYDGGIYLSDESRMLAEMGDDRFRLGSVLHDRYENVMFSDDFLTLLSETMAEGVPGCVDCAYLPYCGSDPVRHYRTQGDPVGFKPTSGFCKKHRGIFEYLILLLEDDPQARAVLRSWA